MAICYLFSILFNFYLQVKSSKESKDKVFHDKLYELKYFKTKKYPYKKLNLLELHPTTIFSLPVESIKKELINNEIVSLDENGYRNNPYLDSSLDMRSCIVFLGSSAGFGIGSSSNFTTIPSLLNKRLGSEYRVYNLAVPSWNSRQELTSLINFLNKKEVSKCKSISSISFTGTADIYAIKSSKDNSLYKDLDSRKELISIPEHFNMLSDNVETGKRTKQSIKFNFENIFSKISDTLFGNIIKYLNDKRISKTITNKGITNKALTNDFKNFITQQIDSFIINHKIINNIVNNLGGTHLVILQPDLNNIKPIQKNWWEYTNDQITLKIQNENCLNSLDLRYKLIDTQNNINSNYSETMSLKNSILKNKLENSDLKKFLFFDDSHLTDQGNKVVKDLIIEENIIETNCFF